MADEVDVDIEGDECDINPGDFEGAGLLQEEQFLQSAWKTSTGILPWELDSSISEENRQVIENMLLEEQYYLTGREMPRNVWSGVSNPRSSVKKSPAKPTASGSSRWSQQEKELFEEGLTQFGRRWTKIAKLVGSRTVLQVKSFAKQYFKQKAKSEPSASAPHTGPVVQAQSSQSSHPCALVNAVRIEKLSDDEDEEVDITDDLSDDGGEVGGKPQAGLRSEPCGSEQLAGTDNQSHGTNQGENTQTEPGQREPGLDVGEKNRGENTRSQLILPAPSALSHRLISPCSSPEDAGLRGLDEEAREVTAPHLPKETQPGPAGTESKTQADQHHMPLSLSSLSEDPEERGQLEEDCSDGAVIAEADEDEEEEEEEDEEEEEEDEELKAPEQEVEMDLEAITEEEKQAIPEFFEGRPSKTPERYLKIRNYILEQWLKSKPKYLNKTSVRPGLKNCGDVNCIGRVHTYLELIGAINFNCEQAVYNRPRVMDRPRHKEGKDALEAYQLAQRLQSMRTRKRRVRDIWGNWCDAKDLEGQTYEHLSAEELALRREELKKQPRPCKISRHRG